MNNNCYRKNTSVMKVNRVREYTNRILDLHNEGIINSQWIVYSLLMWISESDVRDFYEKFLVKELEDDHE